MSPEYVRPYVKAQKNDDRDAYPSWLRPERKTKTAQEIKKQLANRAGHTFQRRTKPEESHEKESTMAKGSG